VAAGGAELEEEKQVATHLRQPQIEYVSADGPSTVRRAGADRRLIWNAIL
jgi:hypothetical protein